MTDVLDPTRSHGFEADDADLCSLCGGFFGAAIHDPNDERGYGAEAHDFEPSTPAPAPQEAS